MDGNCYYHVKKKKPNQLYYKHRHSRHEHRARVYEMREGPHQASAKDQIRACQVGVHRGNKADERSDVLPKHCLLPLHLEHSSGLLQMLGPQGPSFVLVIQPRLSKSWGESWRSQNIRNLRGRAWQFWSYFCL